MQPFLDDYNPDKNPGFDVGDRHYQVDDYWKIHKPDIALRVVSDRVGIEFGYNDLDKILNP